MSLSHSTWPVVLTIYNYPPNLCLKAENCLMSLIILGPKTPENAIDVCRVIFRRSRLFD